MTPSEVGGGTPRDGTPFSWEPGRPSDIIAAETHNHIFNSYRLFHLNKRDSFSFTQHMIVYDLRFALKGPPAIIC